MRRLITRERLHSARIHEHVTVFEPQLHTRLDPTVQIWLRDSQQWLEGLSGTIRREAYLMAYSDAFYLACLALLGCAVGALLLRSHKAMAGAWLGSDERLVHWRL